MNHFRELVDFQRKLNSKEVLPPKALRRNSTVYELVCYVNNITGCLYSKNYEPIPIFIERARIFLSEKGGSCSSEYASLVNHYLNSIELTVGEELEKKP